MNALLSGALLLLGTCVHPLRAQQAREFRVVDILVYRNKPDVSALGMTPGWGTGDLWSPGHDKKQLDEAALRRAIRPMRDYQGVFYLDIEEWPTCNAPESTVARSIANLSRVFDIVRAEAPRLKFGLYSIMPSPTYWAIVGKDSARFRAWQACNRRLAGLAQKADYIFPSLYTFYDDQRGWDTYASAMLDAARAYGKPVYPFLWPQYHESNRVLGGRPLPGVLWKHQLEFTRAHADGVVLWDGAKKQWDDNAPWWVETRQFLRELRTSGK